MEVLLDTNFILTAMKKKARYEEEITALIPGAKIVIPEEVVKELEKISTDKNTKLLDREYADLALQIIQKHKRIKLERKYVDLGIQEYTKKNKCVVATIDKELKKKIEKNAKIITLRKGGYVSFV